MNTAIMDRMKRLLFVLIPVGLMLSACSDSALDPLPISDLSEDDVREHANRGSGLLGQAYQAIDNSLHINLETYTDNLIPNTQGFNSLALGNWQLETNTIGDWNTYYAAIRNLNQFIEMAPDMTFQVGESELDEILRENRIGEAYFLRGWFQWQLLKHYGGVVDGQAMGFPIVTEVLEVGSDVNLERATYEASVQQIVNDLDTAISMLPVHYDGGSSYNNPSNRGRGSAAAAMALKAKVYLYAASPAFGNDTQANWERAAEAASEAILETGELTQLIPYGDFNDHSEVENNIWIQPTFTGNAWEFSYYPPSLFGSGSVNPTQNLVNAFPASDGYPIDESALYDEDNPYDERDGRFERFIFHNGEVYNGTTIETFEGGPDAPGGISQRGTRTGYYMQKFLSEEVVLDPPPGTVTQDTKFKTFLSRAGLYLNFAEAANEAFGPTGTSSDGYTALEAMELVRERAGIDSDPGTAGYQDQYLQDQAAAGEAAFRDLIRNERRVELAFEGDRFWDLRRWDETLGGEINGVLIQESGGNFTYQEETVETHVFQDYMRFVPVPFNETLLMSNLQQNDGW